MNPRLHLSFLVGALWVAGSMEITFFHSSMLKELPLSLRIYSLWFPMPFFGLAGLLAGLGCGGGWASSTVFGVAALLPGARLTRQGDETLPLEARLALARTASVVVSLHMARGREVRLYLPKDRTSPLAQSLPRLGDLPEERARLLRAYAGDPARLALALERALAAQGFAVVKAEGPYALTRVDGAAVLLEVGAERLGTEEARALVAQAIAQGIRAYLEGGAP